MSWKLFLYNAVFFTTAVAVASRTVIRVIDCIRNPDNLFIQDKGYYYEAQDYIGKGDYVIARYDKFDEDISFIGFYRDSSVDNRNKIKKVFSWEKKYNDWDKFYKCLNERRRKAVDKLKHYKITEVAMLCHS